MEFDAIIEKVADKNASYIKIPFDVVEFYGKSRVNVRATFDNVIYDGILVRMGTPCHIIGVSADIRKKLGKTFGDTVHVTINLREKNTITDEEELPIELQQILDSSSKANEFYLSLSPGYQRAYAKHISEAKSEKTRLSRAEKVYEKLLNNQKT